MGPRVGFDAVERRKIVTYPKSSYPDFWVIQ
jgi:hypothetical protein